MLPLDVTLNGARQHGGKIVASANERSASGGLHALLQGMKGCVEFIISKDASTKLEL